MNTEGISHIRISIRGYLDPFFLEELEPNMDQVIWFGI